MFRMNTRTTPSIAPLAWGHGPKILEVFLEPTCPFSAKAFAKFDELLQRAGAERLTLKVRLHSQPWHLLSPVVSRAAAKLRRQSGLAGQILVFAHTSPFRQGPHFSKSIVIPLRRPTADTRHLVQAAVMGLTEIYKPGFKLSKAGVMLLDLMPDNVSQGEFDFDAPETRDRGKLMAAMDAINDRFGRGAIHVGSAVGASARRDWSMRQDSLTPQYTTKWSDMPVARA